MHRNLHHHHLDPSRTTPGLSRCSAAIPSLMRPRASLVGLGAVPGTGPWVRHVSFSAAAPTPRLCDPGSVAGYGEIGF